MLFGVKHSNTMVNLRLFLCITAFSIFFFYFSFAWLALCPNSCGWASVLLRPGQINSAMTQFDALRLKLRLPLLSRT